MHTKQSILKTEKDVLENSIKKIELKNEVIEGLIENLISLKNHNNELLWSYAEKMQKYEN